MKRLHYALVFTTCILATSTCLAQSKQATERMERHKDIAELMSALNNWGVDLNVARQIKEMESQIASDLDYAGAGGVLVVARMEKLQTDSGVYRRLIGDRVDYVGMGSSAVDAEISNIGKPKIGRLITPGSFLDTENSSAYWFSKSKNGEIALSEKPLSWLRRDVINEIADRKRRSYDWQGSRSAELTRLADAMEKKVGNDKVDATVTALLQSRREALSKQATINAELKRELDRAQKAAEGQEAIKALGFLLDYASFVNSLNLSPEKPASSPMTKQQAEARLTEIQNEAKAKSEQLAKDLQASGQTTLEFDTRLEWTLRERHVPMGNLPPPSPPLINPSLP